MCPSLPIVICALAAALQVAAPVASAFEMPWLKASFMAAHAPRAGNDLEGLCAGHSIELATGEELAQLETALSPLATQEAGAGGCSPAVAAEIRQLAALVRATSADLCSARSIARYIDYYKQHLDTSTVASEHHELQQQQQALDKSLKRFALAYGQRMSNQCWGHMARELRERADELLAPQDAAQLARYLADEGPVARLLGALGGGPEDEVFLPSDMAPLLNSAKQEERAGSSGQVFLQTSTGEFVRQLQDVCRHKLRPVYEPLVLPLVRLAHIGLNYRDQALRAELKEAEVARGVARWSRIVFLCETLANIHIVAASGDGETPDDQTGQMVRILTREEAAAIEGTQLTAAESATSGDNVGPNDVTYEAGERVRVSEPIFDAKDAELVEAIKGVKTHRSEQELLQRRLKKTGVSILKGHLRRGHLGLILSTGLKNIKRRIQNKSEQQVASSPAEALVRTLDDEAAAAQGGEGAVSLEQATFNKLMSTLTYMILIGLVCLGIYGMAHMIMAGR